MAERQQFRRLLRDFSYRFLDNELLSPEGDSAQTMVHTLALLAALGMSLSLCYIYRYTYRLPAALRESVVWGDQEFLISIAMTATGVTAVVMWDGLFPDRRDCLVLGALPVRSRTILAAKIAAVLLMFGSVTAALNLPMMLYFPAAVLPEGSGAVAYFGSYLAHATAVLSACGFVVFVFLGLQALLVNLLSFRQYKRVSAWIQVGTLFAILAGLFLVPDIAHPSRLGDPRHALAAHLIPPFWFLALGRELLGSTAPIVHELAALALAAFAASAVIAVAAYSLGYRRYMRKTVEEAEAIRPDRPKHRIAAELFDRILLRRPVERAVFHFGFRTMARNRKHRLLLAIYLGIGLAYVFHNAAELLRTAPVGPRNPYDTAISSVPLILSFFILLGMRVLFTIPVELRANWVFRLTENGRPADYLAGARKLMIAVAILPLAPGTFPVYGLLWGWAPAVRHLILVVLILAVVLEYLMRDFPKIPFTCSFTPGKANLKARFGWYCVLFLFFGWMVSLIELKLVWRPDRYWMGVLVMVLVLGYRAWRRTQWERKLRGFVYEERPDWVLTASLDLPT